MKNRFDHARFKAMPLMGILRGVNEEMIAPLVETCIHAGLGVLEITMNTPGAPALIRQAIRVSAGRMAIGAGTVLSGNQFHAAREAGAAFIVSPILEEKVAELCCGDGVPFFPGAFTPQEIYNAWQAGATMVKVFPAKFSGPEYFKEIKGPFDRIPLLACGGISIENMSLYLSCGAEAFAFGGSVFKKAWLEMSDWDAVKLSVETLLAAYSEAITTIL